MKLVICHAIFLAAVAAVVPARADASRASAEQVARADELFREGTSAFEAGKYSEAYGALRTAWDLAPGYRTAAGLGQVELQLEQYRDAAEHLAYCLRHYPPDGDPVGQAHVEQGLDQAREHVAGMRVRVSVEAADVTVDGVSVGRSPLDGLVFVAPGSHVVAASRAGYIGAEETVDAPVRATREVSLSLVAQSPSAASPAGTSERAPAPYPAEDRRGSRSGGPSATVWVLIAGGSLTAAALATTIVFAVKGSSAADDMAGLQAQLRDRGGSCAPPSGTSAALCARLQDAGDARSTDNQIAMLGGIATGVLAAATVGTALLIHLGDKRHAASAMGAYLHVAAAPGGGGVVLGSRF